MSKQNYISAHDEKEAAVVRRDMWFVLGLNLALLLGLGALYFWNDATGAVDGFFAQIIKY